MMPANTKPKEVTPYSVTFGIIMAVIFSAAAAYLGLKVGQVFEAAIPIAIIAVGVGNMLGKKNMLGQNVIIQSIGASSGVIVAGAIFTLPALYILGLEAQFYQIFLSSLFGGFLGILLLIPFRKYFVKDMHGKYPFPEATATTEVLVSGEKKGNQAKLLAVSGLIGGLYDFCVSTFGWWAEGISTRIMGWGEVLADKMKVVFKVIWPRASGWCLEIWPSTPPAKTTPLTGCLCRISGSCGRMAAWPGWPTLATRISAAVWEAGERAPWTQHLSKFKGTVSARKTAPASGPVAGNSKRQRFFAKFGMAVTIAQQISPVFVTFS